MGMGSGGSSSSTSSGPSAPSSPSTSSVSDWDDVKVHYLRGQKVSLTLPASSHADAKMYDLATTLPDGLAFVERTRTVEGTVASTATVATSTHVYQARMSDGSTPIGLPYELTLTIVISERDDQPSFGAQTIGNIVVYEGEAITAGRTDALPEAFGGNGDLRYSAKGLPAGVTHVSGTAAVALAGTPADSAVGTSATVTYTAEDQDGDTVTLTFTIMVKADTEPSAPSVANFTFTEGETIGEYLPAGSGGNGKLMHSIPAVPFDLSFNGTTRYLSGTVGAPVGESQTIEVTYTVTDSYSEASGRTTGDAKSSTFTITVNAK